MCRHVWLVLQFCDSFAEALCLTPCFDSMGILCFGHKNTAERRSVVLHCHVIGQMAVNVSMFNK